MTTDRESTRSGTDSRDAQREKREAQLQELGARVDGREAELRKAISRFE